MHFLVAHHMYQNIHQLLSDAVWDEYQSTPKPLPALMPAKFVCKWVFTFSKANGRSVKFSETTHTLFLSPITLTSKQAILILNPK